MHFVCYLDFVHWCFKMMQIDSVIYLKQAPTNREKAMKNLQRLFGVWQKGHPAKGKGHQYSQWDLDQMKKSGYTEKKIT